MNCPNCSSTNVTVELRVDMHTLRWIDEYHCDDCLIRWEEWSEPMQPRQSVE